MSPTQVLIREPSVLAPPPPDSVPPSAEESPSGGALVPRLVTALLVVGPVVALGVGIPFLWGHVIHLRDVIIGLVLFLVTGYGISTGYHRLFSHRSFVAKRPLKIGLAIAGSMAVEGSVIGWVSAHRVHHRFTDRPGDPHSPHEYGDGLMARVRGAAHAHVGWLFRGGSDWNGATRDLERDHDLVRISNLFPLFAIGSLLIPFGLGWLLSGSVTGALTTLLWAGAVRMMLLHHTTWSVNSIGHLFGSRPFRTQDRSRNFAPLALVSFGESWHNLHHAYPNSARHGALPHQVDPSARLIRWFELAGWASDVHWPDAERLARLRVTGDG